MIRTHTTSQVSPETIGTQVTLGGWVHAIRHLGKLSFVDLRDSSGIIQLSFVGSVTSEESMRLASELRLEAVIVVTGKVRVRPIQRHNSSDSKQPLEVEVQDAKLINQPESLPFEVSTDSKVPNTLKLKHRPLYLRRQRLQRNIALRSRAFQFVRQWLVERGFLEIDTPILFKLTVGGAREFIVPTRNHPGKFYVLRQSPQQLKQILMASGFEKYFQICKQFHDSFARSQRQVEFTALDLEVAFAAEKDIMALVEQLICDLVAAVAPELTVRNSISLTYADCLERFGSAEPDLRLHIEASLLPIDAELISRWTPPKGKNAPQGYLVRVPSRVAAHHETDILRLLLAEGVGKIDQVRVETDGKFRESVGKWPGLSGLDWQSGLTEMQPGDLILFLVGEPPSIQAAVETSRNWVAQQVDQRQWSNELSFLWIVDQPLFKRDLVTGRWRMKHQAFTAPKDPLIFKETDEPNLGQILGREYMLVCNGGELGGGSVEIHNADLQRCIFRTVGLSEAEIEFYFGHLLQALTSAPPHAGATFSLDSLIKLLARERNASEVIPFPKLGNGLDPLTGAPSAVSDEILEKFNLRPFSNDLTKTRS